MIRSFILAAFVFHSASAFAQVNFYEKGKKALYWGITMGVNQSNFAVDRKPFSSLNDSVRNVYTSMGPGWNLGLIGNWQFNRYFDLRFIPTMVFSERILTYENEFSTTENRVNATMLTLPLTIRIKSEPVNDWRIFILGGIKYDYNVVPQQITLADPNLLLLKKHGLSYEYGIGLQYFFPYFIFSPEIKFSHSFFNMMDGRQSPLNQETIQGVFPRTLTISLNFEG